MERKFLTIWTVVLVIGTIGAWFGPQLYFSGSATVVPGGGSGGATICPTMRENDSCRHKESGFGPTQDRASQAALEDCNITMTYCRAREDNEESSNRSSCHSAANCQYSADGPNAEACHIVSCSGNDKEGWECFTDYHYQWNNYSCKIPSAPPPRKL